VDDIPDYHRPINNGRNEVRSYDGSAHCNQDGNWPIVEVKKIEIIVNVNLEGENWK
jgi:hypothetical protein